MGGPLPPPPPPTGHSPLPPPPSLPPGAPAGDQMELKELIQKAHHNRPKAMMVNSNGPDGGTFHSMAGDPADHYPDLLDIPNRYQHNQGQGQGQGQGGPPVPPSPQPPNSTSPAKGGQPLNPAALIIPPAPPQQFPHQFPHLIRNNGTSGPPLPPGGPPGTQTVPRSHSMENAADGNSPQPILSPPSQFSAPPPPGDPQAPSFVTLPRNRQLQPRGSGQHVDWNSFADVAGGGGGGGGGGQGKGSRYDGTGPRTSATGGLPAAPPSAPPGGGGKPITFSLKRPCSTIPEGDELDKHPSQREVNQDGGGGQHRDSSGSEVTLVDDNLSGFCEPFGKAQPPPPLGSKGAKNRDSIASNASSDMDGMLGSEPKLRSILKGSNLHSKPSKPISFENPTFNKPPAAPPQQQQPQQPKPSSAQKPQPAGPQQGGAASGSASRRRSQGVANPLGGLKKLPPQPPKVPGGGGGGGKESIPAIRICSSTPTALDV